MDSLKIKKQSVTLVDHVEDKLLNYFKEMKMKPGDAIPNESELAEALGVARSVLREALSRLRMGEETLLNLLGFRVALEIGICSTIIENLTDSFIEELEIIVNNSVVYENNLYTPVNEHEFHSKLYEITGNKIIMQFQEIIYPVSLFVKDKFFDFFEPINRELNKNGTIVNHKDLLNQIKTKDKDGLRKAIEMHFEPYHRFLMINGSKKANTI